MVSSPLGAQRHQQLHQRCPQAARHAADARRERIGGTAAGVTTSPGTDDGLFADHGTVENRGGHSDQTRIFDGTTVEHDAVPDGDVIADNRWVTVRHIVAFVVGDMNHAQILNTGAIADFDVMNIPPYDASEPDTHIFTELNPPDDVR